MQFYGFKLFLINRSEFCILAVTEIYACGSGVGKELRKALILGSDPSLSDCFGNLFRLSESKIVLSKFTPDSSRTGFNFLRCFPIYAVEH